MWRGGGGLGLTWHSDGLLESDGVGSRDALDLDVGFTEDGHAKGLVGEQPGVEHGQGVDVVDVEELADFDRLERIGRGLGEVDLGERSVGRVVLEIHDTRETIDDSMN